MEVSGRCVLAAWMVPLGRYRRSPWLEEQSMRLLSHLLLCVVPAVLPCQWVQWLEQPPLLLPLRLTGEHFDVVVVQCEALGC